MSQLDREDEAVKLMKEAGYGEGGKPLKIEIRYNTNPNHERVATAVADMWKKEGRLILWDQPRSRNGFAVRNRQNLPVSDKQGWNWNGEDPDEWYPLDLRFTVVVVEKGAGFSGWSNYVDASP